MHVCIIIVKLSVKASSALVLGLQKPLRTFLLKNSSFCFPSLAQFVFLLCFSTSYQSCYSNLLASTFPPSLSYLSLRFISFVNSSQHANGNRNISFFFISYCPHFVLCYLSFPYIHLTQFPPISSYLLISVPRYLFLTLTIYLQYQTIPVHPRLFLTNPTISNYPYYL